MTGKSSSVAELAEFTGPVCGCRILEAYPPLHNTGKTSYIALLLPVVAIVLWLLVLYTQHFAYHTTKHHLIHNG